jgi:hypothetical protein
MKRAVIICSILLFTRFCVFGQVSFQTIAEKSDFKSTSNYADVKNFMEKLTKASHNIRLETIATSAE